MDISRVEKQLLFDLGDREAFEGDEYLFDFSSYLLKETDSIKQIQEIVYYIERLEGLGFVTIDEGLYEESDKISFEYMNSAVEIDFNKVHISELGRLWIEEHGLSAMERVKQRLTEGVSSFFNNRRFVIIGYVITFTAGLIIGMMIQ